MMTRGGVASIPQAVWGPTTIAEAKAAICGLLGVDPTTVRWEMAEPLAFPVVAKDGTILRTPDGLGRVYGYPESE